MSEVRVSYMMKSWYLLSDENDWKSVAKLPAKLAANLKNRHWCLISRFYGKASSSFFRWGTPPPLPNSSEEAP